MRNPSYLGGICINAVAFVVDVSQLLLQVELDPVVKSDDCPSPPRLSDKHVLETWRIWPGGKQQMSVLSFFDRAPLPLLLPQPGRYCLALLFHPPAGSSPGIKFKPNPVQLLFELRLVCRREMLLHQVFMSYLPNKRELRWSLRPRRTCIRGTGSAWTRHRKDL